MWFVNHLAVTAGVGGGGVINHFLFRRLDLNRNAAKVSESLKISDPPMTKLFSVVFFEVATA